MLRRRSLALYQLRPVLLPRVAQEEGVASVHEAIKQGINLFDCSPCVALLAFLPVHRTHASLRSFYGDTRAERVLGRALKDIPRDQVR